MRTLFFGRRKTEIIILSFILVFLLNGCGPKQSSVYHVGILSGLNLFSSIADSFREEMTRLGYVEGKNIVYDLQKTNFEPEKEKQILRNFVIEKVNLIFGFNTEVAVEAKNATKGTGIPVIFANALIEGSDLIENVRQPGGNITGVRYPGPDIAVKRLQILHEIVPQAKQIWLPYQKGYPTVPTELELVRQTATSLNLKLTEFASEDLARLQAELKRRSQSDDMGFDAVLLIPESLSTTKAAFDAIASYTKERKIPIGGSRIVTEDYGTLFAVTINNDEIGVQAARLADKVLKGISAGTIPVESPESYIIINYKVAQNLGLKVSEGLLSQADEIIR